MKKLLITILSAMIATSLFSQKNINWTQINIDLAKVDSLEAISQYYKNEIQRQDQILILKDSILFYQKNMLRIKDSTIELYDQNLKSISKENLIIGDKLTSLKKWNKRLIIALSISLGVNLIQLKI